MNTKFKIVLAVVAGAAFGAAAVQSRAKGSRRKLLQQLATFLATFAIFSRV